MKDGLICGVIIGMIAGALLYKHNPEAKQIVNDTEQMVKKEIKNLQSTEKSKKQ